MTSVGAPLPARGIREAWQPIGDICEFYRVTMDEWRKLAANLGDESFDDIALLTGITDDKVQVRC